MLRKYVAYYDNGHEYGSFIYHSHSRAGIKQNLNDAKAKARLMYGKISKSMYVLNVERIK